MQNIVRLTAEEFAGLTPNDTVIVPRYNQHDSFPRSEYVPEWVKAEVTYASKGTGIIHVRFPDGTEEAYLRAYKELTEVRLDEVTFQSVGDPSVGINPLCATVQFEGGYEADLEHIQDVLHLLKEAFKSIFDDSTIHVFVNDNSY